MSQVLFFCFEVLLQVIIYLSLVIYANAKDVGSCTIERKSCLPEKCDLRLIAYSNTRIYSIQWFQGQNEVDIYGGILRSQYKGPLGEKAVYCSDNKQCIRSELELVIEPFLQKNYGIYRGLLITRNGTKIQCETEYPLSFPDNLVSGNISVKTDHVYIIIGTVAGCLLLIVILLVTVLHLARRNKRNQAILSSMRTRNVLKSTNRKPSEAPSHHTYASISSDGNRYQELAERRGTTHDYENPLPQQEANESRATNTLIVPGTIEDDDDISDFSFNFDSASTTTESSIFPPRDNQDPKNSSSGRENNSTDLDRHLKESGRKVSADYHNIKKTRRLT